MLKSRNEFKTFRVQKWQFWVKIFQNHYIKSPIFGTFRDTNGQFQMTLLLKKITENVSVVVSCQLLGILQMITFSNFQFHPDHCAMIRDVRDDNADNSHQSYTAGSESSQLSCQQMALMMIIAMYKYIVSRCQQMLVDDYCYVY